MKILNRAFTALLSATMLLSSFSASAAYVRPQGTVAFMVSNANTPFYRSVIAATEARAKQLGYKVLVIDSKNNSQAELTHMEDLSLKGVKAVILNPIDHQEASHTIRMAARVGMPLITIDRRAAINDGVLSHISVPHGIGGQIAGDFITKQFGLDSSVIELKGAEGASSTMERHQGFLRSVKSNQLHLLASVYADFDRTKALKATRDLLQKHKNVQAIFAHNDEMALGAAQAVKAMGRKVAVIGFDGTQQAIGAVENGMMLATVGQPAEEMGHKAIETVDNIINGRKIEPIVHLPLNVIVKPLPLKL